MTDELKPIRCGCGGEAVVKMWAEPDTPFLVMCEKCKASSGDYSTEAEAIEAWNLAMSGNSKMKTDIYFKVGKRSGKTLESAVDYLRSVGWLQEHDRIMTESAEPERTAKVIEHDASITDTDGIRYMRSEYLCSACKKKVIGGDEYCSHCGARLEWE